jgi:hypothetical protein
VSRNRNVDLLRKFDSNNQQTSLPVTAMIFRFFCLTLQSINQIDIATKRVQLPTDTATKTLPLPIDIVTKTLSLTFDMATQTVLLPIDITPQIVSLPTVIATQTVPLPIVCPFKPISRDYFGILRSIFLPSVSTPSMKIPGLEG